MLDETRIDRYLAAVRLVKTRQIASQHCEGGHVRVNGRDAKPSTKVRVGDRVEARIAQGLGYYDSAAIVASCSRILSA